MSVLIYILICEIEGYINANRGLKYRALSRVFDDAHWANIIILVQVQTRLISTAGLQLLKGKGIREISSHRSYVLISLVYYLVEN